MSKKILIAGLIVWMIGISILIISAVLIRNQENEKYRLIHENIQDLDLQHREILNKLHEQEGNMG